MYVLSKIWNFIKEYWYLPVFAVVSILAACLLSKRGTPLAQTQAELQAIKAGSEIKKLQARLGADAAGRAVESKYRSDLQELDVKQKQQALELSNDPAKLAKFLVRAGARR